MTRKGIILTVGIGVVLIVVAILLHAYMGNASKRQGAEDEQITYYYRQSQPKSVVPILKSVISRKDLIAKHTDLPRLIHFFAAALQENSNDLEELRNLHQNLSGQSAELIKKVLAEAQNYHPVEVKSPEDLELVWSEFKATGREGIIEGLIKMMDWPGTTPESQLGNAVRLFLVPKAPHHVELYNMIRDKSDTSQGKEKRLIDQTLDEIRRSFSAPAERHMRIGLNFAHSQEYGKALKEYQQALAFFPDYSAVYVNMANAYEQMGKLEEAFNSMKRAAEIDPEDPGVAYGLGRHNFRLKHYDAAIKCYLKALEYHPDKHIYNHAVARAYQEKGDTESAVTYFKKYLEQAPNGEHVHLVKQYLASVGRQIEEDKADVVKMLKGKQYDSLEKHFATLLREKQKDEDGNSVLRNSYSKLCGYPDVQYSFETWVSHFKDWVKQKDSSHFAHAATGISFIRYGWHARGSGWGNTITDQGQRLFRERLLTARDHLEKAHALDPSDPIVPARLIDVARGLGSEPAEMEKQFQRAIQADQTEYQSYYCKLNYLMPKWYGTEQIMLNFAREAARRAPPKSLIPFALAEAHWELYFRSNDRASYFKNPAVWKEVREVYQRLSTDFPDSKRIHNWFAVTAYLSADHETARRELRFVGNHWLEEAWGDKKYFDKVRKELLG